MCASGRARCKNRSVVAAILGKKNCLDNVKNVELFSSPSPCDACDKVEEWGWEGEKKKTSGAGSLKKWFASFFPRDSLQISPIL